MLQWLLGHVEPLNFSNYEVGVAALRLPIDALQLVLHSLFQLMLMIVVHGIIATELHHIKGLKPIEITDNVKNSL